MTTPLIYFGASTTHVLRQLQRCPEDWTYVRRNVAGWYINNFALRAAGDDAPSLIARMGDRFNSVSCYYETDFLSSSEEEDMRNLLNLRKRWMIDYIAINRLSYATLEAFAYRRAAIHSIVPNCPILLMVAPWKVAGDFRNPSFAQNATLHERLLRCQGTATDGPLPLWAESFPYGRNFMRERLDREPGGSVTTVLYPRSLNPNFKTSIMLAPNEFAGESFLSAVQDCVYTHTEANAIPDMWVITHYGPDRFHNLPTLPETYDNLASATTLTGAAHWLLKHYGG